MMQDIKDLSIAGLEGWLTSVGEPRYRARQIFQWLYQKKAGSFAEMSSLPAGLISKLRDNYSILLPEIQKKQVSKIDGTEKYLLRLIDGEFIETVLIPIGQRLTACFSSQVGCRYRCGFCASGMYGFKRDLSQAEILSQLLIIPGRPANIVFMGTGEPLDNFKNVAGAIRIINDKSGFNIGARRITISTAGIPDGIKDLAKIGLQIELSVSLHAADDKKRDVLMPINRIYLLDKLLNALKGYKRVVTFEYTVIKGINDSNEDADKLAKLLKGQRCKVNLIPLSPVVELSYKRPETEDVLRFKKRLNMAGVPATIRASKGADIQAACGQLRGRGD